MSLYVDIVDGCKSLQRIASTAPVVRWINPIVATVPGRSLELLLAGTGQTTRATSFAFCDAVSGVYPRSRAQDLSIR